MDVLSVIAPLVGVVLGSALSGLATYLKQRGERKRTIAVALADLLEIRHRLVTIDVVFDKIRARVDVSAEIMPVLRNCLDSFLLPNDGLDDRYNNAISLLAGIDPVLAFSLRSKNAFPRFLGSLRKLVIGSGTSLKEFESLESTLRLAVQPNFNAAAMELAGYHSWSTKRRVRRLIAHTGEIPPEVTRIFDQLTSLQSTTAPTGGGGHG